MSDGGVADAPPQGEPGSQATPSKSGAGRGAFLVATGIFLSRIAGLARTHYQAKYFGLHTEAGDAFWLALRVPNFLQNLLGEGVLSAAFIPRYSSLRAAGDNERARNLAGSVFWLLALLLSLLVLLGELFATQFVALFSHNYSDSARDLAVSLVRIVFPGTAVLVLSAWCLAVLNSHRRFLLSYTAPVLWNIAILAFIIVGALRNGAHPGTFIDAGQQATIVRWAAWGAVAGSLLQFLVQVGPVLALTRGIAWQIRAASADVKQVIKQFVPAVTARGSVQLSAFIDLWFVGRLSLGSQSGFGFAQTLFQLPISLFGMAVSAAELPEISATAGGAVERDSAAAAELRRRLGVAMRRMLFFVVPSAAALAFLGDRLIALLLLRGMFEVRDVIATWVIVIGFSFGVVPATMGRLVATSFFAMHDTSTPRRFAVMRIALGSVLSALFLFVLPKYLPQSIFQRDEVWRVAGLSFASSLTFWLEFAFLRNALISRIGPAEKRPGYNTRIVVSAALAVAVGLLLRFTFENITSIVANLIVIAGFGITYLILTSVLRVSEISAFSKSLLRR